MYQEICRVQRLNNLLKYIITFWTVICICPEVVGWPTNTSNKNHYHICSNSLTGITSYYDSEGEVKDFLEIRKSVLKVLVSIGMTPSSPKLVQAGPPEVLPVLLDGRVVGSIASDIIEKAVSHLRRLKVSATSAVRFCLKFVPPLTLRKKRKKKKESTVLLTTYRM